MLKLMADKLTAERLQKSSMAEKEPLEKRAQKAIIQESFFRPESAVILAITMIITAASIMTRWAGLDLPVFSAIHPILWLLGGALVEGVLMASSITDAKFREGVVAKLLRDEFRPEALRDKRLQRQMSEALDYRSRIEQGINEQGDGMLADELRQTASQIDEWLENMYDLARKIDRYQTQREVLERDRKRAESRLLQLQHAQEREDNAALKQQLQVTAESVQRQLQTLSQLDDTIKRANLQLENSLIHLSTIYSQTMLVDAKDIDRARARRLRQEITEEVTELNDLLVSMDEVYATDTAV